MVQNPEIARRLDQASEGVILAVVVLAPWAFGAVEAWAGFLIAAAIVALSMLVAASTCVKSVGRSGLATPGLALLGLALLALAQAAPLPGGSTPSPPVRVVGDPAPAVPPVIATIAQDREAAIGAACWLVLAWTFFLSVFHLGSGHRVAVAIAINSAVLALFAMIQALTWNGKIYWMRDSPQDHAWFAGGPFVCHNHLAAYLNLGLGFAIGFLVNPVPRERGGGRGLRLGWAYVAGVVAVGVIGSQSRGGTVAMLVALVAVFAVTGRRSLVCGLAALGMTALMLVVLGGGAMSRLATVLDSGTRGYAVRFEVWRAGLRALIERPMLGAGLGSFATAAAPYLDRDRGVVFTHAESEPIQLLAEGGLVAAWVAGAGVVALVVVARRAWRSNPDGGERPLVLGAIFGLLTVAIQSLGDFPLHIPAVALAAVASAALLTKLAREIRSGARKGDWLRVVLARCLSPFRAPRAWGTGTGTGRVPPEPVPVPQAGDFPTHSRRRRASWVTSRFFETATIAAALLALAHARSLARAESALAGSGVPLAGPAITAAEEPTKTELQRMAAALERALIHRPNWSQGHLRLGETRLALYQAEVSEWINIDGTDAVMADPLWLIGLVHDGKVHVADLAIQEPVALYLIPATHSFLEARRANPASASAYVGLASLHYLLKGDEPATILIDRARRLAGADAAILAQIAEIAVRLKSLDQAARCWRRILAVRSEDWEQVADAAGAVLSPEVIRDAVATGGRDALRFADHLYAEDRDARNMLMAAALERLPNEIELSKAERLSLEAHARAALGQVDMAQGRMEQALALEPSRGEWREELIGWLMSRGEVGSARRHARIGLQLCPGRERFRTALEQTTEALSQGLPPNPPHDAGGEAIGNTVRPRTPRCP